MIHFVFYEKGAEAAPGIRELILRSIEALWVSTRFNVLIELFYNRDDNIRSVRVFRLRDGYRVELVKCFMSDRGKDRFELWIRAGADLEEVKEIVGGLLRDSFPIGPDWLQNDELLAQIQGKREREIGERASAAEAGQAEQRS